MQNVETTVRNMEQTDSKIFELTDAELDAINGGNWLGDAARWVYHKVKDALGDGARF